MRFRLILATAVKRGNETAIPVNYQYELSSWIYKILNLSNPEFARWLHDSGFINAHRKFKLFTFSNLKPARYQIKGDRMFIAPEETELIISFFLPDAVEHFITGLFKNQHLRLGDKISSADFIIRQIEKLPDVEFKHHMCFSTISPMIISSNSQRDGKYPQYISPQDDQFADLFINNLVAKYMALAEAGKIGINKQDLQADDRIAFKLNGEPRSKLIKIKAGTSQETFLRGYHFTFELSAPEELVRIGYYAGFGEKNSLGFGCVEEVGLENKVIRLLKSKMRENDI